MKLSREFYNRPALEVATDLLGKVLVRRFERRILSGTIVETEAYVGPHDLACHASKGRTPRTEVMFGPPGFSYVYQVYGFHFCFNVVTEPEGYPAAVLIRALEPLEGTHRMRQFRGGERRDTDLTSGPGKLCQALAIDKRLNGEDLLENRLWIEDRRFSSGPIAATARVGINYAGKYADKPWRFFVQGNPHVSRTRTLATGH